MSNNKLGLKIVRINQGYTDLLEINGNSVWTKNIWDIRKDLEHINNLDDSTAVLMLTSIDSGHILTVASIIEGRISDCISAWIYVPVAISIAGKKLVEIVNAVKNEILANERNDERLIQLFSESYESAPAISNTAKSNGEKCAYRYYGQGIQYTLPELLQDMCQSYYKNYKSIFLLDNSAQQRCLSGDNLTEKKVYSMITLNAPDKVDAFAPYIDGKPFVKPMAGVEGDVLEIEWKRSGYESIQTQTTIREDLKYSIPMPNQYRRLIPYSLIKVVDQWNMPINDYTLRIEDQVVNSGYDIPIREDAIKQIKIDIEAEGYEAYCKRLDLTQSQTIKLSKKMYEYQFSIPLYKSQQSHTFKLKVDKKLSVSPIEGYMVSGKKLYTDGTNKLVFQPAKLFNWLTILLSVVALSLGIVGGYFLCYSKNVPKLKEAIEYYKNASKTSDTQKDVSKASSTSNTQSSQSPSVTNSSNNVIEAIKYLDNQTVWILSEMEQYDVLKGLWQALNNRQFEKVLQYEKSLNQSTKFARLVEAIKNNKETFQGTYCPDGDTQITINGYIRKLTPNGSGNNGTKKDNQKTNPQEQWQ